MIKIDNIEFDFDKPENDIKQLFKFLLNNAGLSLRKAVEAINEKHPDEKTTPQNISNKFSRGSMKFSEFVRIAEICGYSISFNKKKNGKVEQEEKVMKKFIGILKFDNGTKIPVKVDGNDKADAFYKITKYCKDEGYFPDEIEVIGLFNNIGIIEI